MSDHDDITRRAAVFAENVRREMRHMPADAVADITDGLEADTVASLADGGTLPDAGDYARDLMRAAGYSEVDSPRTSITGRVVLWLRTSAGWLLRETRGLEPAWWVFRAWVMMQALGWMVSDTDSTYWFLGQWGGEGIKNGFVGVIFLAVFLWVSVRIGRDGWLLPRRAARIFSLCLACFAGLLFVSETYSPSAGYYGVSYMYGSDYTTPGTGCRQIPDLLGYDIVDATAVLTEMGIPFNVVDPTGYDITNSAGIDGGRVEQQDLVPPGQSCVRSVILHVDPRQTRADRSDGPSDSIQQTVIPATTTSMPGTQAGAVTTTIGPRAKATTTTAP